MCVWRFRIDLQGELPKTAVLAASLEGCSARLLSVSADRGQEMPAGEFMVDIPHHEGIGAVLSVLHEISPRVLIGLEQSCEASQAASARRTGRSAGLLGQPGDVHAPGRPAVPAGRRS